MTVDLLLPQDLDAEQQLLGALLVHPAGIVELPFVQPDDFFDGRHAHIFQVMRELDDCGEQATTTTLEPVLAAKGFKAAAKLLYELDFNAINSMHLQSYASRVASLAEKRRLIDLAAFISESGYNDRLTGQEIIEQTEQRLYEMVQHRPEAEFKQLHDILSTRLAELKGIRDDPDSIVGIPTGFRDLDAKLGGLLPANLIILAARPGAGKSALATAITINAAQTGRAVALFSLEMGDEDIADRVLASLGDAAIPSMRNGTLSDHAWQRVTAIAEEQDMGAVFVNASADHTIGSVRQACRRLATRVDLGLVVVDYLGLMTGKGESPYQMVSNISRGLKVLAKGLNVPVLALHQLSRKVDERSDKRPQLTDLRDSGAIEQDADICLFIYRDIMYNPETEEPNVAEIIIDKHRNGARGKVKLYFDETHTKFGDLAHYVVGSIAI